MICVWHVSPHREAQHLYVGGIKHSQQYILLGLLPVTEHALLATVTLLEECSFVILKNISFKTDSQTNPNFMLGIQCHTSPASSRSKWELVLFCLVLCFHWSVLLLFIISLTAFLQNLRWSQFSCCGGSCLNCFPGDVMNRKPRHCKMAARCHLKVSPHKGKMCSQIEEKQQIHEPVAVQISMMGYSWSSRHSQRKVKSWGTLAAITKTVSFLLA